MKTPYLPCEYVSLELSAGIFAKICSVTSVKFPAQLAYLASTVVPLATVQNRIGILQNMKVKIMSQGKNWGK